MVESIEVLHSLGVAWKMTSKFCQKEFKVSFVTWVKDHYIGGKKTIEHCPSVLEAFITQLQVSNSKASSKTIGSKWDFETLASYVVEGLHSYSSSLEVQNKEAEGVDKAFAKKIYGCKIPLHNVESCHFLKMIAFARDYGVRYIPP